MLFKNNATFAVKKLPEEDADDNKYCKVRDHCYYTGKDRVVHITYVI